MNEINEMNEMNGIIGMNEIDFIFRGSWDQLVPS